MKKVIAIMIALQACFVLSANAQSAAGAREAARRAKGKSTTAAEAGNTARQAGTRTVPGSNLDTKEGLNSSDAYAQAGRDFFNKLIAESVVRLKEIFGNCERETAIQYLSQHNQSVIAASLKLGLMSGTGCLGEFDVETGTRIAVVKEAGLKASNGKAERTMTDEEVIKVIDAEILKLHQELELEGQAQMMRASAQSTANPEAKERLKHVHCQCNTGSARMCSLMQAD